MNETIGVSLQILPIPVDRSVSGIKQNAEVKVIMPEDYREGGIGLRGKMKILLSRFGYLRREEEKKPEEPTFGLHRARALDLH